MRGTVRGLPGIVVFVVLLAAACPAMAESEHKRDTWYIGFGVGTGFSERYAVNGQERDFGDWFAGADTLPRTSINFKVGATLSNRTLFGFDGTALGQSGEIGGTIGHIQINNYFAMLTHFPKGEGFFIRAGGGLSNIGYTVTAGGLGISSTVNGHGYLLGVGYAKWSGRSFNITLNLDMSWQNYSASPGEPEDSAFTIAYVGFDWY